MPVNEQQMATYRATARRREAREQIELAYRRQQAWELARRAALLLKGQFGVERLVVFGSLARGGPFDQHSDVDLAVWGLDQSLYYRAVADLLAIDPLLDVDLVRVEDAPANLRESIAAEGVSPFLDQLSQTMDERA